MADRQAGGGVAGDRRDAWQDGCRGAGADRHARPVRPSAHVKGIGAVGLVLPAATGLAALLAPLAAAALPLVVAVTHVGPTAF